MQKGRTHKAVANANRWTWIALMIATAMAWLLGTQLAGKSHSGTLVAGVVAIAALKILLVGFQYMELRSAPRAMGAVFACWVFAAGATLIVIATQ